MAQVNYSNPEGMYPLQTGVQGEAFGSGTVPGSILAGMLLPERMQDYRTSRDLSQQASGLANQQSQAQLQDYLAGGDLRQMQRMQQLGTAESAFKLQSDQHKLATMNLQGDIGAAGKQNELKVAQALHALPAEQRANTMNQMLSATALLQGIPEGSNPNLVLQYLHKNGVNTEGWNPSYVQHLRTLDPTKLKQAFEREQTQYKETQHMSRTEVEQENANLRARIAASADRHSAAGAKVAQMDNWKQRLTDIQTRFYENGGKYSSAAEQAEYNAINSMIRSAEAAASGNLQVQTQSSPGALNLLQNKPSGVSVNPPTSNFVPKTGESTSDNQDQIKQQLGNKYNPKIYEYRINPQTGKIQQKKKGK